MGDPALTQMYNVTVNGGNEKLRFSTSLTQHNQDGIISNSGVRRTNMNTKINVKLAKNVNLLVNLVSHIVVTRQVPAASVQVVWWAY